MDGERDREQLTKELQVYKLVALAQVFTIIGVVLALLAYYL